MQVDLAFFQQLLTKWMQFTLDNVPYAVCLAVLVWLLTAVFYSLRIAGLKGRIHAVDKARQEANAQIEAQQQTIVQLQQTVEADKAEIERAIAEAGAETQRAEALESRLVERNGQFASTMQAIAGALELADLNLPANDDAEGDALWNQREDWIGRFAGRFDEARQAREQAEQRVLAETAKLAEKELTIAALQVRLDGQSEQLTKLERAAAEQAGLAEELAEARRQLAALQQQTPSRQAQAVVEQPKAPVAPVEKPAVAAIAEPTSFGVTAPKPDVVPTVGPSVVAKPVEIKTEPAEVKALSPEEPKKSAPANAAKSTSVEKAAGGVGGKLKGMFGSAIAKMEKIDELLGTQSKPMIDPENQAPIQARRAEATKPESVAPAAEPAIEAPTKKAGLFGFGKKKEAKQTQETLVVPAQVEVVAPAAIAEPAGDPAKKPSKMTGLLGRFKKG